MLTISSFIEPKKKGFCFGLLLEEKKEKKKRSNSKSRIGGTGGGWASDPSRQAIILRTFSLCLDFGLLLVSLTTQFCPFSDSKAFNLLLLSFLTFAVSLPSLALFPSPCLEKNKLKIQANNVALLQNRSIIVTRCFHLHIFECTFWMFCATPS